jgi:hypothetical protein
MATRDVRAQAASTSDAATGVSKADQTMVSAFSLLPSWLIAIDSSLSCYYHCLCNS